MIDTLVNAFRTPEIRRKLFFVAAMLVVFRLLSHVPVPGADPAALSDFFQDNALSASLTSSQVVGSHDSASSAWA
jgi:preprotein translocase subunit SecY